MKREKITRGKQKIQHAEMQQTIYSREIASIHVTSQQHFVGLVYLFLDI